MSFEAAEGMEFVKERFLLANMWFKEDHEITHNFHSPVVFTRHSFKQLINLLPISSKPDRSARCLKVLRLCKFNVYGAQKKKRIAPPLDDENLQSSTLSCQFWLVCGLAN